jgi:hypothetical protein
VYSIDDTGYMEFTALENPSRIKRYLNSIESTCFTCGSSLQQRGGSYLFLRYLYEQAEIGNIANAEDGSDFVHLLTDGSQRDLKNIAYALSGNSSNTQAFPKAFSDFALAVYFSSTGQSTDAKYEFTGLDLRGMQNDNRGTVLNGPSVITLSQFPLVDTLTGNSIAFVQISGKTIAAANNKLKLNMGNASQFKAFLIQ